jgi:hypothetical protein
MILLLFPIFLLLISSITFYICKSLFLFFGYKEMFKSIEKQYMVTRVSNVDHL